MCAIQQNVVWSGRQTTTGVARIKRGWDSFFQISESQRVVIVKGQKDIELKTCRDNANPHASLSPNSVNRNCEQQTSSGKGPVTFCIVFPKHRLSVVNVIVLFLAKLACVPEAVATRSFSNIPKCLQIKSCILINAYLWS